MLNKVQLIGRTGDKPEVRYTTTGDAVANVSLATTEWWKDKKGQKQEKTEWHNLVFYRGLAEVVGEYVKKGALIYVEGKLTTEKYEKNGDNHYITKIIVSDMKMLGGKTGGGEFSSSAAPESAPDKGAAKGKAKSARSDSEPF